ncbi:MAG: hypothetical protein NT025_04365 [bacterium]|nr:hypothetical protein [bacterium]
MTNHSPGLIKPFNLGPADYEAMYHGPLPDGIIISINTLTTNSVTYSAMDMMRRRIKDVTDLVLEEGMGDPLGVLKLAPCPIIEILECVHPHVLTPDVESILTPAQTAWMVDGAYHQLGFHIVPEQSEEKVHAGTGLAMSLLDWWHCTTKSLDPHFHVPTPFSASLARHHDDLVGDLYRTGTALWHEQLVRLRNELLIVTRAANTRQSVFKALDAFRASGRVSVLW